MIDVSVIKIDGSLAVYLHANGAMVSLPHLSYEDLSVLVQKLQAAVDAEAPGVQHFDAFWASYPAPRRFNKTDIRTKWRKLKLDAQWPRIKAHLAIMQEDWQRENYKFCPHVTTYINQRRWEAVDESQQQQQAAFI